MTIINKDIPPKLFKYKSLEPRCAINQVLDIINNERIYMPSYSELNDPAEGMAHYINLGLPGTGAYYSMGELHPVVWTLINSYGVLSMTDNPRNFQMWTQYGGYYNGICLEMKTEQLQYEIKRVNYIENVLHEVIEPDEIENIVEESLLYKYKDWQHEREYRIFIKNQKYCILSNSIKSIFVGNKVSKINLELIIKAADEKEIDVYIAHPCGVRYTTSFIPYDVYMQEYGAYSIDDVEYNP